MGILQVSVRSIILFLQSKQNHFCTVFLQRCRYSLHQFRFHPIIRIHKPDIFSDCLLDPCVSCSTKPLVYFVMYDADTRICFCNFAGNLCTLITSTIINHKQLPVFKCLCLNTSDCFLNILFYTICWHHHTKYRSHFYPAFTFSL